MLVIRLKHGERVQVGEAWVENRNEKAIKISIEAPRGVPIERENAKVKEAKPKND